MKTKNKSDAPEEATVRTEIKPRVMRVNKKDNEKVSKKWKKMKMLHKRQEYHNSSVYQDIKNNAKREVSPVERDNSNENTPPTTSSKSETNLHSPMWESHEESYDSDAYDDSNDIVSTTNVAIAQKANEKVGPLAVTPSSEDESTSEDESSIVEEFGTSIVYNEIFVPVKENSENDSGSDSVEDSDVREETVPVSQETSENKSEFEKEAKMYLKVRHHRGNNKEIEESVKDDVVPVEIPISNMEKENGDNEDEIPAEVTKSSEPFLDLIYDVDSEPIEKKDEMELKHIDCSTGKEKGIISIDRLQKKEKPAEPTLDVNDSHKEHDDKSGEMSVKVKECSKRIITSILVNDESGQKKHKKEIKFISCDQPGHKDGQTTKSGGCSDIRCFKCNKFGHMSRECPKRKLFEGGTICFKCNEIGHMSRECPKQKCLEGGIVCFNCNEIGHMSRECPNQKFVEGGRICFKCNEIGHMSRECPNQKFVEGGRICFKCNESGHLSRDCLKQKSFEGGRICFTCNEIGHMSRECPKQKSFEGGTICFKCSEIGHRSRECPKQKSFEGVTRFHNSNKIGHMSREYTKKISDGGCTTLCHCNVGGSMHREYPSKYDALQDDNRRAILRYTGVGSSPRSTTDHLKLNYTKCFDCQKVEHSCIVQNDLFKHIDFFTGKEKLNISRGYPHGAKHTSTIQKRGHNESQDQIDDEFRFKVRKGAKRSYDSMFHNGSGLSEKTCKNEKNCFSCNQFGHMDCNKDCVTKNSGGGHDRICFKCNEIGHMSRECPMKTSSLAAHGGCNCDDTGLKDCQTKKFSEGGMICFNCNGVGHTYNECPSIVGVRGNDLRRYITSKIRNEVGRTTEDWRISNKVNYFGSREHLKTDCADHHWRNNSVQNGRFTHINCFNCKETGHISRDCPHNKESRGRDGTGHGCGSGGYGKGRNRY